MNPAATAPLAFLSTTSMPRTKRRKIIAKTIHKAFPDTNTAIRQESSFLDIIIVLLVVVVFPIIAMLFV